MNYWSFSVIKEKSSRRWSVIKTPKQKEGRMLLKVRVNGRTAGTLALSQTEINDFRRRFGNVEEQAGKGDRELELEPAGAGAGTRGTEAEEAHSEVEATPGLPEVQG